MAYRGLTIIFASFLIFLGQFGYSSGQCEGGACNATELGTPRYLTRTPNAECIPDGDEITFKCADPWPLEGPSTNTCNNGTWDDGPTTCNVSCTPPDVENLILNPNKTSYEVEEEVNFSCDKGYKFTSDSPRSAQCKDTGMLNPTEELKCIAFNCSAPTHTNENLNWTGKGETETYNGNETITYSCSEGLKLEGSDTDTCIDQDEWELKDPKCSSGNVVQVFWYFLLMTTFYSVFSFNM